jgi:hypothetical protein
MKNIVVVGCGASGMMAAIQLARKGHKITIIEKNEKPGKKLFITGKGRCNVTNNCDEETFLKNMVSNPKFMYSSIYNFNPEALMDFFEKLGLHLKTERGNRVFPASDHSSDVITALVKELKRLKADITYDTRVSSIKRCDDGKFILKTESVNTENAAGMKIQDAKSKHRKSTEVKADAVVIATGGKSYRLTGSTGDGYEFAESFGLKSNAPHPALVPLEISNRMCGRLMGLSLKNVSVTFKTLIKGKMKVVYEAFGEMIFTHFGVSGPIILSASSIINKYISQGVDMYIDFKPAVSREQLDARLLREFSENRNKNLKNAISDMLPKSLIPELIEYAGLDSYKKVNELKKEERERLIEAFKGMRLSVTGTRGFDEAIITQGGVLVSEINPQTMESKKIPGLYFIGEVLDLDAFTGGFNLQIAWSTAMSVDVDD